MEIRPTQKDDLPEINSWYRARGLEGMKQDLMPFQGFIVPGHAAGFLIKAGSGLGFIEGFVTNPAEKRIYRTEAIHMITKALIKAAHRSACSRLFFITEHPIIKSIAKEYGFSCLEKHTVWGRDI